MEFKAWPKIVRVENRRVPIFTEKIDGTNACVVISFSPPDANSVAYQLTEVGMMSMWVQSRNRFIIPGDDNFGFAGWVFDNSEELFKLGEGHHYGEWWGSGIGRTYGINERRFSLFNTKRWGAHNPNMPSCVSVVPVLDVKTVEEAKEFLKEKGSVAAPGFNRPEGAIMYDLDTETYFKIIMDK